LVISYEEIDQGLDILEETLEHIQKQIDTKGKSIFFESIEQSQQKNQK
jgi:hypothetical protein